jgi:prepilin-type processing-associated H-X9-DG protein
MKQVVLAIHNYEATWRCFPQHDWDTSFLVHILPEIDQAVVLDKINPYAVFDPLNPISDRERLGALTIPLYQCPSDPSHVRGGTNYMGNFGYGYQQSNSANGVIVNLFKPLRFANVTDGLSHTALLSECVRGSSESAHRLSKVWRTPYALHEPDQLEQFMALCRLTAESDPPRRFRGGDWVNSVPATIYTHTLYPNDVSCGNAGNGTLGIYSAASLHPGGVNLVFCDGHASFIQTAIDLHVWRAIGTRHGGESVSEF